MHVTQRLKMREVESPVTLMMRLMKMECFHARSREELEQQPWMNRCLWPLGSMLLQEELK
jgi:hypothetical protein